jgi:glycosyltransferase involved in cell wall biosynthesis
MPVFRCNTRLGRVTVQVLFITWDGPRSTYLEGLFLPIFAALRERGFTFHVLQFTWADRQEREASRAACAAVGMSYRASTIWRRPVALGSLATALLGQRSVLAAMRDLGIDLLMPRSTLPALAAIPAAGSGANHLPVLLDADGLPHDERVDFENTSPTSISYRLLRSLEAWSVRRADAVTVRTARAAAILAERAGGGLSEDDFHIVANARDANLFKPSDAATIAACRGELGITADQPLVVYAGSSLRGKYRGESMLSFFRQVLLRRPDARLLLLMPQHDEAHALLSQHPDIASACLLRSAAPADVPAWLGAADLGLALIHATFSMQAVAAIKVGEYLLCGVPVLASSGVGDTEEIIDSKVGLSLGEPDESSLGKAATWFLDTVLPAREQFRTDCRAAGLAHYSLESAIQRYDAALRTALSRRKLSD